MSPGPLVAVAPSLLAPGRVRGWTDESEGVPAEYLAGLRRAGLVPAVLGDPGIPAAAVLEPWAGVVLCGGPDVDPGLYGQAAHPTVYGIDPRRDRWEAELCVATLDAGLPLLAICRGIQILNVALGGTLVQHLPEADGAPEPPDVAGGALVVAHGVPQGDGLPACHSVEAVTGSRLSASQAGATRLDSCVSIHHQALDRVAGGLEVTGRAEDGTIEAVETPEGASWCLAVQWHPERSAASDPAQQGLFDAFAAACRGA